jgi:tetratricopeptide (TPR) repeat protein
MAPQGGPNLDHPSLVELAGLYEGRLSPHREKEVVRHLLFQRCGHCLSIAPEPLRVFLGLESARALPTPEEEAAYEGAIERACKAVLEDEQRETELRSEAEKGLRVLQAGRKLSRGLEPLSRMRALLQRSWQLRHEDLRETIRLARSAVKVSLQLDPKRYGAEKIYDYQAEAYAELGNTYRAADQIHKAELALDRARELFERGTRPPLLEVRLLELEACLLAHTRQFGPASHKLLKVLRFYSRHGDRHRLGRTLVLLGLYSGYAGNYELGIHRIKQSLELIDLERDPMLACAAAHNLILLLVESGRISEAKKLRMVHSRHLVNPGGRINEIKFRALEGLIDVGLGNLARAEVILREVVAGFDEVGLPILAGIDRLHLATVLLRQGKAQEATRTVCAAVEIFIIHGIQREALQAIILLRDSFEVGRGTLEMVLEVAAFLRRLEIDPDLRFEGRSWELPEA